MEYRARSSSARENVGLRTHSQNVSNSSLDERTTLTTVDRLFQRSNSTASIKTDTSRNDTPRLREREYEGEKQQILFQTAPRRSSWTKIEDAKFICNTSYGGKMEFPLIKNETFLGRNADNDIILPDVKVSKRHALIVKDRSGFMIKDLQSSNGIRINDNLIEPNQFYPLKDNDMVLCGPISLLFCAINHAENHRDSTATIGNEYIDLVTILPSERKYEETVTIRAELEAEEEVAFMKSENVEDIETIRGDYEKLRLVYELSKMSVTDDINKLLSKSLDLLFEILPLDRGVILLHDQSTGYLTPHYVKLRQGLKNEKREILLSSTILHKVFYTRKCLHTSDACEDPMLGKAASVRTGQIRSVICVPLIAHNRVYGILHLDSNNRVNPFSNKDLSLVKAIGNQTAMVIENMNLIKEVEAKARITEQLSRFLPPHVVDKMTNRSEIIRKGGRELYGTVVFADIRGFTNISEKSHPMEVVKLLNDYFEKLVKIVFKYDGVVDKYIGDAIMAVFGTLEDEDNSEYRATLAGMEFQKAIADLNEERLRAKKEPISIGVGINSGLLLAGFIGSSQRLEYTVIGDTVNTSSRICDFAARDSVYISESTYNAVKDSVECTPVGARQFKGKKEQVMLYAAIKPK